MLADEQCKIDLWAERSGLQEPAVKPLSSRKADAPRSDHHGFSFLTGGGEMGELIRAFDWSKTSIGGPEHWSPALKTMLQIMLANRFPHILWWGPEYVQFYNDPYRPYPGTKHPQRVLGQRGCDCWSEIWHIIGPLIDRPFRGGPATWDEDILLEIHRHDFTEETHFTIAYSPVPDETAEGGIGGVLATVHEITQKVVGERRVVALRDLGAKLGDAKTAEDACTLAASVLAAYDKDIPFALLYLSDGSGRRATLAASTGVDLQNFNARIVDLDSPCDRDWPFADAQSTGSIQVIKELAPHFAIVPEGPWSDPPTQAVILNLPSSKPHEPAGYLVAGLSSRLRFDQFYQDFFELVRTQIATAIANARAYEEERKRAEALAEVDRAKTAFFNNVSHEFRTPLTLLLGPAEEILKVETLSPDAAKQVEVIHRNALRLQKLVNTLLDFSRIEAGRVRASFVPTNLSVLTRDLASVFRSAIEKAGLKYSIDIETLPEPVFVDREMWEKIVFNLLSNAFKFTLNGEVRITLRREGNRAILNVADTGVGIPADAIQKVFKRFYRVEGRRGRTHEGTGIGLALVQELVKLHGGTITVSSTAEEGSTFTVEIPLGKDHLPHDQIDLPSREPKPVAANAFTEEALTWIPEDGCSARPCRNEEAEKISTTLICSRVLLVEDNADMRRYARRLLEAKYTVEAVPNGELALDAARANPPDLILSDVMMPEMNGLELVRAIRSDEKLRRIPVILLSARAGEEDRIEGATQLADDYVTKPFSARELLARIDTQIQLSHARTQAQETVRDNRRRLQMLTEASQVGVWFCDLPFDELTWDERVKEHFWLPPDARVTINTFFERLHPDDRERTRAAIEYSIANRARYVSDYRTISPDGRERWIRAIGHPHYDANGKPIRFDGVTIDIGAEARNRFLVNMDDALRPLTDSKEIVLTAARILGERLGVDRCAYADVEDDGDTMNLAGNYLKRPEIKSIVGRLKFSDFGPEVLRLMREDKAYVVENIDAHQPPVADLQAYRETQIQSVICVPLHKAGRFVAAMAVHMATPRRWTPDDVELVRAVAARCWESIERGRLERELGRHAEQLESVVEARTASLREALAQLEEFSYSVSHDLRSPLRAIAGYNNALREDFGEALPPAATVYLEKIARNADRMEHLVNDVLTFSRVARGDLRLHPISLQDFIQDIREQYPAMHEPAAELSIDTPHKVMADEAPLGQAISNLLTNAVKFVTPSTKPIVRVRSEQIGERVRLWVEDSGIGIAPHYRNQLFGMFQRLPAKKQYDGTGIGLAIVRKAVERMGGSVGMEPNQPNGCRFWLELKASI